VPGSSLPRKSLAKGNLPLYFRQAGRRITGRGFLFANFRDQFKRTSEELAVWLVPARPVAHGGMSKAQLIDLQAAIDGKITWAEYYQKWGGGSGPSL
jgi:hypothetical protein